METLSAASSSIGSARSVIQTRAAPGISIQSANNIIEGNYIGTDVSGTVAQPNRTDGIQIDHPGNRVGGTTAAARNVISGNAGSGIVSSARELRRPSRATSSASTSTGTARLGNVSQGIIVESANNVIGGDVAAAGNVISGNGRYGVVLNFAQASGNIIAGNLIGTNGSGTGAIGNTLDGVYIPSAGNRIGGTLPVSRNVISGNGGAALSSAASTLHSTGSRATTSARTSPAPSTWAILSMASPSPGPTTPLVALIRRPRTSSPSMAVPAFTFSTARSAIA